MQGQLAVSTGQVSVWSNSNVEGVLGWLWKGLLLGQCHGCSFWRGDWKRFGSGWLKPSVCKLLILKDGAFLHFSRVCNSSFSDLLREKPSSLFMLSGWSSISVSSLMICSMYLAFMPRILVSWNWLWWPRSVLCSAMLISQNDTTWCAGGASSWSQWNTTFAGVAVDNSNFQAKFILNGLKEISHLSRQEAYSFYVISP